MFWMSAATWQEFLVDFVQFFISVVMWVKQRRYSIPASPLGFSYLYLSFVIARGFESFVQSIILLLNLDLPLIVLSFGIRRFLLCLVDLNFISSPKKLLMFLIFLSVFQNIVFQAVGRLNLHLLFLLGLLECTFQAAALASMLVSYCVRSLLVSWIPFLKFSKAECLRWVRARWMTKLWLFQGNEWEKSRCLVIFIPPQLVDLLIWVV